MSKKWTSYFGEINVVNPFKINGIISNELSLGVIYIPTVKPALLEQSPY